MAAGRKTGGRVAGTLNKRKSVLLARLQEQFPNYHPILELARIANDQEVDVSIRKDAHKEVAKYVEPQLKAIEHTGGDGPGIPVFIMQPPPGETSK